MVAIPPLFAHLEGAVEVAMKQDQRIAALEAEVATLKEEADNQAPNPVIGGLNKAGLVDLAKGNAEFSALIRSIVSMPAAGPVPPPIGGVPAANARAGPSTPTKRVKSRDIEDDSVLSTVIQVSQYSGINHTYQTPY